MEEQEKTRKIGEDKHDNETKPDPVSSESNLSDAVAQMPSQVTDLACTGIQRRPRQTDQKFMTPQEIGLILRQLGDNLEKLASGQEANRTEKGG
jgi:hypothetical protein